MLVKEYDEMTRLREMDNEMKVEIAYLKVKISRLEEAYHSLWKSKEATFQRFYNYCLEVNSH